MTAVIEGDRAVSAENAATALRRFDQDGFSWNVVAKVEKFDIDAIQAAKAFFNLPEHVEPLGWQLQAVASP